MSDITYKEIVDYLRESTGDANWYLNNKIGLPVAHRYMNAVSVRNQVTEAAKVLKKKKEEEHAGQFAHAARQAKANDEPSFKLGNKTFKVLEAMCNECGMAETKCGCMKKEERKVSGKVEEKYMGFEKLKRSLAHKKGVKNPAAVAAAIGRKKYGKAKFQHMAAAGKMHEDSAAERDHTHAAHFHDHKGNWSGMALITAKSDDDAVKQAHELAQSDRYKDFKLAHVEKHTAVKDLEEVLDPSMGASKYIHDFVHSDNPKFHGKSKKERIRMALGAYYNAKKHMHEDYMTKSGVKVVQPEKHPMPKAPKSTIKNPLDKPSFGDRMKSLFKKEAVVISSEEELAQVLDESFFLNEEADAATLRAWHNVHNKGSKASRKNLDARHANNPDYQEFKRRLAGEKPSAPESKPETDGDHYIHRGHKYTTAEVDKVKKSFKRRELSTKAALDMLHNARKAASAKHATSGVGGGGKGAANVSPLDTALSRVKEKPAKGAGASPAELDAAEAEKKAAEKKKPSDTTKKLTGKIEEGLGDYMTGLYHVKKKEFKDKIINALIPPHLQRVHQNIKQIHKIGKKMHEELNTDMVDDHEGDKKKDKVKKIAQKSKVKKKYENKKMTLTGEKVHKVVINPEIGNVKV